MPEILAIGNNSSFLNKNIFNTKEVVVLDAKKLLELLNLEEEGLTSELLSETLLSLSSEERDAIFSECTCKKEVIDPLPTFSLVDILENLKTKQTYEMFRNVGRCPEEIKRELKYEKNPMRKIALERELSSSYGHKKNCTKKRRKR